MTEDEYGDTQLNLENAEYLFREFKKATPSSPIWYQMADICIGVLMTNHIDDLKHKLAGVRK